MHFFTANIIDTNLLHDALCVRAQRERERERESWAVWHEVRVQVM